MTEIIGKAENFNERLLARLALMRVAPYVVGGERLQAELLGFCSPSMLCPRQTVRHSPGPKQGNSNYPKEKITIYINQPNIICYIAGLGPLNNN